MATSTAKQCTMACWIQLMSLLAQLAGGTITVPDLLSALESLFSCPQMQGDHKKRLSAIFKTSPIPANLQIDLQGIVDAGTNVEADNSAVAAANAALSAATTQLATDSQTMSDAQAKFSTDLAAYLASLATTPA